MADLRYIERHHGKKISFTATERELIIHSEQSLAKAVDATFALADLSPDFQVVNVKHRDTGPLGTLSAALALVWPFVYLGFTKGTDIDFRWMFLPSVVLIALFALLWMLIRPSTDYARFFWHNGNDAVAIGKHGRDKDQFEPFVSMLAERIRTTNGA